MLINIQCRFIIIALRSCLLGEKRELQIYTYIYVCMYVYLRCLLYPPPQLPLLLTFIYSCGFKLLSSVFSFHPEGLPLVFFVEKVC